MVKLRKFETVDMLTSSVTRNRELHGNRWVFVPIPIRPRENLGSFPYKFSHIFNYYTLQKIINVYYSTGSQTLKTYYSNKIKIAGMKKRNERTVTFVLRTDVSCHSLG